jgi:hypothetical protein
MGVPNIDRLQALGASILVPEGEVAAVVAIVPDLVGGFESHCVCVHAVSMAGLEVLWGKWWTLQTPNTRSAMASVISVARHHFMGAPCTGHIQIMQGSPHCLAMA